MTTEKKTYSDLLKDPRWQKKRLEILSRDEFTCQYCYSTTKTLHVHHGVYEENTLPWDHTPSGMVTLCHDCHEKEEYLKSFDKTTYLTLLQIGVLRTEICDLIRLLSTCSDFSDNTRQLIRDFWKHVNEYPEFKGLVEIISSNKNG